MQRRSLSVLALPVFASMTLGFALGGGLPFASDPQDEPDGYDDTPFLPDSEWRVHDIARPVPPVVEAPAERGGPPGDAKVLFDGQDTSAWRKSWEGSVEEPVDIEWKVEDGAMVVTRSGQIETREHFGDVQLHIEWSAPTEIQGKSQGRGNSGVFLFGKYEIQILDSYENRTYADGQAASLYGQAPPAVNAMRPPGEWQVYDIVFQAPRFEGDELVEPARATVFHNGVCVHHDRAYIGASSHRSVGTYSPHAPKGPIALQDHGNPVRFRNIWVRELDLESIR